QMVHKQQKMPALDSKAAGHSGKVMLQSSVNDSVFDPPLDTPLRFSNLKTEHNTVFPDDHPPSNQPWGKEPSKCKGTEDSTVVVWKVICCLCEANTSLAFVWSLNTILTDRRIILFF
ncbi:hypothetical protein STEG23_037396, partial [Scotinomys teguina]